MNRINTFTGDILIVDDNVNNLKTLEELLLSSNYRIRCAGNAQSAILLINTRNPELILCDVRMPDVDGYELCRQIKTIPTCKDIPVIFMSAAGEVEEKLKGFAVGGVDFITKPFDIEEVQVRIQTHLKLFRLQRELEAAYEKTEEQVRIRTSELESTLSALLCSERKLALHLDHTIVGVIEWDADFKVKYWNPAAEKMFGFSKDEAIGKNAFELMVPEKNKTEVLDIWNKLITQSGGFFTISESLRADKSVMFCEWTNTPLLDENGSFIGVMSITNDITLRKQAEEDRQRLQEQLAQSQKMESIGLLAGGVAHDFNNMLSGIMSAADFLHSKNLGHEEQTYFLDLILSASSRAADLTSKLLAFARKGSKSMKIIDISKVITDTIAILKRSLDKRIVISMENAAEIATIMGDDSILQNVFMNMGINAGHAMPDGGNLRFTIRLAALDDHYCKLSTFDIKPGKFIEIAISDTGCGMSPEILKRIFEPFFTTKEPGKGTGLGLAEAYGTIQDHHGAIDVMSKEHEGTVFKIYLPLIENSKPEEVLKQPEIINGSGVILLVDDEEIVRTILENMLKNLGYTVHTANDGLEAIRRFKELQNEVQLVVLDMVMPKMNGREVFTQLRAIKKDIPVILSSGFSKEESITEMMKNGLNGFIKKPFRLHELSQLVAKAIKENKMGS